MLLKVNGLVYSETKMKTNNQDDNPDIRLKFKNPCIKSQGLFKSKALFLSALPREIFLASWICFLLVCWVFFPTRRKSGSEMLTIFPRLAQPANAVDWRGGRNVNRSCVSPGSVLGHYAVPIKTQNSHSASNGERGVAMMKIIDGKCAYI